MKFYPSFVKEMKDCLRGLQALGEDVPIQPDEAFQTSPEFYFIVANNNKGEKKTTPKQTMGAYLLKENSPHFQTWKSEKPSVYNVEEELGFNIMRLDSFPITCLFTTQTQENLSINDIIDTDDYEREIPE